MVEDLVMARYSFSPDMEHYSRGNSHRGVVWNRYFDRAVLLCAWVCNKLFVSDSHAVPQRNGIDLSRDSQIFFHWQRFISSAWSMKKFGLPSLSAQLQGVQCSICTYFLNMFIFGHFATALVSKLFNNFWFCYLVYLSHANKLFSILSSFATYWWTNTPYLPCWTKQGKLSHIPCGWNRSDPPLPPVVETGVPYYPPSHQIKWLPHPYWDETWVSFSMWYCMLEHRTTWDLHEMGFLSL